MTITFHYNNLEDSEEDNYGKLWSWYITNLDKGDFEQLTTNISYARKLDRFITSNSKHSDSIVLILLLPTIQINRSPNLLGNILNNFYTDDLDHDLEITPMGHIKDLQATILMIKDNNELTQTNSINVSISQKNIPPQAFDVRSIISGESGYIASEYSKSMTNNDSYLTNDNSKASIDLTNENDADSDSDSDVGSDLDSITGAPLSRVATVEEDEQTYSEPIIQVNSQYEESASSLIDDDDDDGQGDNESVSSVPVSTSSTTMESLRPFPTTVSAMTTMNHQLILKSILFKSFQDGEKRTSIRQFGNGRMSDDWLLYDDEFSLDNLLLLTLSEVLEMTKFTSKVLFYSLDNGEELYDDSDDEEIGENDLTVTEFNGLTDDLTQPIRFVQSNTTIATTPIALSKTSTLRTNHDSIRSEYMIHKPDTTYSSIQKSKSAPISMKNKIRRKNIKRYNNDKCIII